MKIVSLGLSVLLITVGGCARLEEHAVSPEFSQDKNNFTWPVGRDYAYYTHADAWCCHKDGDYWVVVEAPMGDWGPLCMKIVLLCLTERNSALELQDGLVVWSSYHNSETNRVIEKIRGLDPRNLHCCNEDGLQLRYEGWVSPKPLVVTKDTGALSPTRATDAGQDYLWLHFAVTPKENPEKVRETLGLLEPLLSRQHSAKGLLECFSPVLPSS